MYDSKFDPEAPFSDEEIGEIERALGRELPQDYRDFVKQYGGAYVGGLVDGLDKWPIVAFLDAADVLDRLDVYSDLRDEGALAFGHCVFGNLWVLARDNSVHFLVNYGGTSSAQKVSNTFQDLVDRIVPEREDD